jgi:hypothetical protein
VVHVLLRFCFSRLQTFLFLLSLLTPAFCSAAESSPTLIATAMGAQLYAHQAKDSEIITNLEKGEELLAVGQAIGTSLWYMVKTPKGAIGWVQSGDVSGVSLPEDPMTIDPGLTIPGSQPVPAEAYDQPGIITQLGYQGPGGHPGPLIPEEQKVAGKNIDLQRIGSRSSVPYQVFGQEARNLVQCVAQADAADQTRWNKACAIQGKPRGCALLAPVAVDLDQAHRAYIDECYKHFPEH